MKIVWDAFVVWPVIAAVEVVNVTIATGKI